MKLGATSLLFFVFSPPQPSIALQLPVCLFPELKKALWAEFSHTSSLGIDEKCGETREIQEHHKNWLHNKNRIHASPFHLITCLIYYYRAVINVLCFIVSQDSLLLMEISLNVSHLFKGDGTPFFSPSGLTKAQIPLQYSKLSQLGDFYRAFSKFLILCQSPETTWPIHQNLKHWHWGGKCNKEHPSRLCLDSSAHLRIPIQALCSMSRDALQR